jgi:hypothetical protein
MNRAPKDIPKERLYEWFHKSVVAERVLSSYIVVNGWTLPGKAEALSSCGKFYDIGCLKVDKHVNERLDIFEDWRKVGVEFPQSSVVGKGYAERHLTNCRRLGCPICYANGKSITFRANEIVNRLDKAKANLRLSGRVVHVVISVPKSVWGFDYAKMRSLVQYYAKKVGVFGGSLTYHPFRWSKAKNEWYFSPHFHSLCYAWIDGNKVAHYHRTKGWIIKNVGVRKSVFSTAFYILSHCGIHTFHSSKYGHKATTWFGVCAYNKLRVGKEVIEKPKCPLCGSELVYIMWDSRKGKCPIPEAEGQYVIEPGSWYEIARRWTYGEGG